MQSLQFPDTASPRTLYKEEEEVKTHEDNVIKRTSASFWSVHEQVVFKDKKLFCDLCIKRVYVLDMNSRHLWQTSEGS